MKRVLVALLSVFLVMVFASRYSFAEPCGCSAASVKGFRGEGMHKMQPKWHDGREMWKQRQHHLWKALMSLGLDENQKEAIQQIHNRTMKDVIRKRADLAVARIDLREVLGKDQVDMGKAEEILKSMASLQTDIRLSHIKAMVEIKMNLTPEQRKNFKEKLKEGRGAGGMKCGAERKKEALPEKEQ